jgi:hypothetical protein
MQIKIVKNAGDMYINDNTDYEGNYHGNPEWEEILFKISGKLVEVNEEELFKHEFNTLPIPDISEEGIRIPEEYVEEIIGDVREGKARCDFCNEVSNSDEVCTNCGRSDYLEAFLDDDESYY